MQRARAADEVGDGDGDGPPSAFRQEPGQRLWPAGCSLDDKNALSQLEQWRRQRVGLGLGCVLAYSRRALRGPGDGQAASRVSCGGQRWGERWASRRPWSLRPPGWCSHQPCCRYVLGCSRYLAAADVVEQLEAGAGGRTKRVKSSRGGPPCFVAREALRCVWPLSEAPSPQFSPSLVE